MSRPLIHANRRARTLVRDVYGSELARMHPSLQFRLQRYIAAAIDRAFVDGAQRGAARFWNKAASRRLCFDDSEETLRTAADIYERVCAEISR